MSTHNETDHQPLDLAAMRQQLQLTAKNKLAARKGKDYWRSLNELADSDEFEELVRQEFPRQSSLLDSLNRRDFLKVLGASLALAGLTACAPQETSRILPYVDPPRDVDLVPGKYLLFASTHVHDGYGRGVLLKTATGRPVKVEGNPGHPDSLGATDMFMQASLLEMYDPERAKQVLNNNQPKQWGDFAGAAGGLAGGNLRILSGPITSPSLTDQMAALLRGNANAVWYQYSPVGRSHALTAANQAFGAPLEAVYNFTNADVILSLDSDFLGNAPGSIRYGHDFALRHQPISANGTMSRLYVVESALSITGGNADHRLAVKPSQVEAFARALASRLGVNAGGPAGNVPGQEWLDPLAADLKKAGRAALVLAGEGQPPAVHALAMAMNQALGAVGNTVNLIQPLVVNPQDSFASIKDLVQDLNGGRVDTLVILDGNPVYTAPADLNFAAAMKKAKQSIYLGLYQDETAAQATWFIPAAHYMETWGDARAFDGTTSIIQPVIQPLYGGKSPHELIAALMGQPDAKGYDLVRTYWQGQAQSGNFDQTWRDILSKGIVPNAGAQAGNAGTVNAAALGAAAAAPSGGGLEIMFMPDETIWDGRYSNNAWLQELPKPISKLTWDNAAYLSPSTAAKLGVKDEDVVTLKLRDRSVDAPVLIIPGQADDVVVVTLGYGRKAGGSVLEGAGFNANAIRTSDAPWMDSGVQVTKTGRTYKLATTREHWSMENRDLIREANLSEYQANPKFAQHVEEKPPTLYGEDEYPSYAWGMSINLNTCIGCNACVVACQAENNIPTVGKDQVLRGREMHWLRIDRYYHGSGDKPRFAAFQPVPCMHCEKAPCEPVCPVEATSHSAEGLNEMTYNRCVGTRYCSNNCPYKVRRFNFYKYSNDTDESLKAMRNPEVSVRSRGVMEKCTYCVQRITDARIEAEVQGRRIQDGEVKTACQQACPTNAIIFGDIHDANSQVRKQKETPLNYGLLDELGTRPRTTYQAKVKNPNPNIKEQA